MPTEILPLTHAEIPQFLSQVPLFIGQPAPMLVQIAQDCRIRTYRNKDILFHQGDLSHSLYIVYSGKVRTYHLTVDGEETTVNILARRQLLGEFAVIDGEPRSATAQAISPCTLLEMSGECCLGHMARISGLALAMCRQLAFKARWTSTYAETIARFEASSRLAHLLLLYCKQFGEELQPGVSYRLDWGLSQSDLATMVGATRGWVNDILQKWRKRGLVAFADGQITILDLERLKLE